MGENPEESPFFSILGCHFRNPWKESLQTDICVTPPWWVWVKVCIIQGDFDESPQGGTFQPRETCGGNPEICGRERSMDFGSAGGVRIFWWDREDFWWDFLGKLGDQIVMVWGWKHPTDTSWVSWANKHGDKNHLVPQLLVTAACSSVWKTPVFAVCPRRAVLYILGTFPELLRISNTDIFYMMIWDHLDTFSQVQWPFQPSS